MRHFFILLSFVLLLCSCSSKKNITKPSSNPRTTVPSSSAVPEGEALIISSEEFVLGMKKSTVRLNYRIDKKSLNDTFNHVIDTLLSNEIVVDGMDVKLEKKGDASIEFEGDLVLIQFPLGIKASKETFLKTLHAEGLLHLDMITQIDISKDWKMDSETTLTNYEWVEVPKLKMGMVSFPVERLMNIIIEKSKDGVVSEIDRSIRENITLRKNIYEIMQYVAKPILLDKTSNTKLKIVPDTVLMTGARNQYEWTEGMITVVGGSVITQNMIEEVEKDTLLPVFEWNEDDNSVSDLYFNLDFNFKRINSLLNEKYAGTRFEENGNEIVVNNIELKGLENKLGVIADVTGSYNGQIFLSGIPDYDPEKKYFTTKDIEVKLLTKNILHKALAWMLKGRIKKELDKMLQISLGDYLSVVQEMIDERISSINDEEKLEVVAQIQDVNLEEFKFSENKIHTIIHVPVFLQATIYNMFGLKDYGTSNASFSLPD